LSLKYSGESWWHHFQDRIIPPLRRPQATTLTLFNNKCGVCRVHNRANLMKKSAKYRIPEPDEFDARPPNPQEQVSRQPTKIKRVLDTKTKSDATRNTQTPQPQQQQQKQNRRQSRNSLGNPAARMATRTPMPPTIKPAMAALSPMLSPPPGEPEALLVGDGEEVPALDVAVEYVTAS